VTAVPLVQGVPLDLEVTVEGGAARWPGGFEARGQVRTSPRSTTVHFDLTPHLTSRADGADVVVELHLTGAHTRQIDGGVFDIYVAEGDAQTAALRVLSGTFTVERAVTRWT